MKHVLNQVLPQSIRLHAGFMFEKMANEFNVSKVMHIGAKNPSAHLH